MTDKTSPEKQRQNLHRINSAAAWFQKGIYHLFMLQEGKKSDAYSDTLRTYQCLYSLGVVQLLLDYDRLNINLNELSKREQEWAKIDLGSAMKHRMVQNKLGFPKEHLLHKVSKKTLSLFNRAIDARDNLIYRPFLHDKDNIWFWEDCTLEDLLKNIPKHNEIERVYQDFYEVIKIWDNYWARAYFITSLAAPLSNPPLTLLLNYVRLLNPSKSSLNLELLNSVRKYRHQILGIDFQEEYLDKLNQDQGIK